MIQNVLDSAVEHQNIDFEACLKLLGAKRKKTNTKIVSTIFRDAETSSLMWCHLSNEGIILLQETFSVEEIISDFQHLSNLQKRKQSGQERARQPIIGIARYPNGTTDYHTEASLMVILTNFIHSSDSGVQTIQAFLGGQAQAENIYRTSIDKTLVGTSVSMADVLSRHIKTDGESTEAIGTIITHPVRVTSTSLVSALKINLESIIQSIESQLPGHIDKIEVDFLIDSKNHIYLEWVNSASFIPNILYQKQKEDHQNSLQSNDRLSWLGSASGDVARFHEDLRSRRKKLPPTSSAQIDNNTTRTSDLRNQIASAASNVELSIEEMKSSWKDLDPITSLVYDNNSHSREGKRTKKRQSNNFPTPFKCEGDFCDVIMDENEILNPSDRRQGRRIKDVFSENDWKILDNDLLFNSVSRTKLNPLQYGMISKKSVILGRGERQSESLELSNSIQSADQVDGYMKRTQLASIRNDWSKVRGEIEGGSAVFYDLVRVCGRCLQVYELLDKARIVLQENKSAEAVKPVKTIEETVHKKLHLPQSSPTKSKESSKIPCTWKGRAAQAIKPEPAASSDSFQHSLNDLDDYLRGKSKSLKNNSRQTLSSRLSSRNSSRPLSTASSTSSARLDDDEEEEMSMPGDIRYYRASIFVISSRESLNASIRSILEENKFKLSGSSESKSAIETIKSQINETNSSSPFDAILIDGDDGSFDACEFTKEIRISEKKSRPIGQRKRLPIICLSENTSLDSLKSYRGSGMDGCIGIPLTMKGVVSTLRSAVPHHLAQLSENVQKVVRIGAMGLPQDSNSSEVMAASASKSKLLTGTEVIHGIVQIDAQTRVPYTVMDFSSNYRGQSETHTLYNVVVLNDLFDTCERYRILLKPMASKYPGMQVLLWNFPGQSFSTWRQDQCLNNDYYSSCLNSVLGQVGTQGTDEFDTTRPYFILGIGNGANVAMHFASHYRVPNLRGIISLNGYSFVDSFLAGAIHDCINVFSCSPSSRPDLPIYFYSRFLFSQKYLAKVSAPLALNIYTAVHNPISLQGRIDILKGALNHVDLRPLLNSLNYPLICIQSTQDALVRPIHTEPLVLLRKGEVRSIHQALKNPEKSCVIWIKSGHEAFQENRKQTTMLIEQILTGFHDKVDISFPPAASVDPEAIESGFFTDKEAKTAAQRNTFLEESKVSMEDKFLNGILKVVSNDVEVAKCRPSSPISVMSGAKENKETSNSDKSKTAVQWEAFQMSTMDSLSQQEDSAAMSRSQTTISSKSRSNSPPKTGSIDPLAASQKHSNSGISSRAFPDANEFPEIKEYMNWRIKRNKKRLQRLERAALTIQSAHRAYKARFLVKNAKKIKASIFIQRVYRGWTGRRQFNFFARLVRSAMSIQRAWRGHLGRNWIRLIKHHIRAATTIQRNFRAYLAKTFVKRLRRNRYRGATEFQGLWRRCMAKKVAFRKRTARNSAIVIQRIYRGHVGKKKSKVERDKYVFSRSQAHGIEFGRQMLLEHKLYATKLQSEISILSQEKAVSESKVEEVLVEISEFEEEVKKLESEMHQLSRIETESKGVLDVEGKFQLREQKLRLDKHFCEMITRIKSRKGSLKDHEKELIRVDRLRQSKEEELRVLERKLVVLLEEQQRELESIRKRQERRGEMLIRTQNAIANMPLAAHSSSSALVPQGGVPTGSSIVSATQGENSGYSGPSPYEKKAAAEMMESAETLMKFGFMSMSMTYFSSLNMIKAMRTVAVQDTVMAAVSQSTNDRLNHAGSEMNTASESLSRPSFKPSLRPGQTSGQESLRVSAWSVEDVAKWLDALRLGQYREAFIDASVDGEFLYDLDDDDLRNTLSVEHCLHRKKILQCVHRLKVAEAELDSKMKMSNLSAMNDTQSPSRFSSTTDFPAASGKSDLVPTSVQQTNTGTFESFDELANYSKHGKLKQLQKALDGLPTRKYEKSITKVQYVPNFGTAYQDDYERQSFHTNKMDEHGNSLLIMAAQNGHDKIAKYLITKGCNPDHQNKSGQTAAHFAIAYNFLDLSTWLFEGSGGGASDSLENKFGLLAYDGLGGEE